MKEEKFKELMLKADEDLTITHDNILIKSLEIPKIYSYYLKYFTKEMKSYKDLLVRKDNVYADLFHYYKFGDFKYNLEKKSEIEPYIFGNVKYQKVLLEVNRQQVIFTWLELLLKNINAISFNIKNYVEYKKFGEAIL